MKAVNEIRKVGKEGRFPIPSSVIRKLDIKPGDFMEIFTDGNHVLLSKFKPACCFCGKEECIQTLKEKFICQSCLDGIGLPDI